MDDRNFDQQTAAAWIKSIEANARSIRDDDIYPMLNEWLESFAPNSVLDLGCGQGICSDRIQLRNCHYTGVEPSPALLQRARELYSGHQKTFLSGNAYRLPSRDGEFDAVFSVLVWHLLENLNLAARELSRVLKINGRFMMITAHPNAYSEWKKFYSDFKIEGKKLTGRMQLQNSVSDDVLYLHSFDEICDSLRSGRLSIEDTISFRASKDDPNQNLLISIYGRKLQELVD